jgi:hypothetical protein
MKIITPRGYHISGARVGNRTSSAFKLRVNWVPTVNVDMVTMAKRLSAMPAAPTTAPQRNKLTHLKSKL